MSIYEFKLADIGEGIHEAEILQIFVSKGEFVKEEQELLEINTEKVSTDLTSPLSGEIVSIEVKEGDIVKVGEVLVRIKPEEKPSDEKPSIKKKEEEVEHKEEDPSLFKPASPFRKVERRKTDKKQTIGKILAAPAVRKKARELKIDLAEVKGSGTAGRITFADIEKFKESTKVGHKVLKDEEHIFEGEEEIIPLRGLRRNIVKTMRHSKSTAAHYTFVEEVDMTNMDQLRDKSRFLLKDTDTKLTYLPIIIKATIAALKEFPILNASLDDEKDQIVIKHYYNIGIAVDTDDGLIVPVIKQADQKGLMELAREINKLATKAKEGKLSLDDVSEGTFTITSTGNIGGLMATPIIKWPEVGILGIMRGRMQPIAIKNDSGAYEVAIRKMMNIALSLDHRVVDGAVGARFAKLLIYYLENPSLILL